MKYPFFKEDTIGTRTQVTFVGDKLDIYIPKSYLPDSSSDTSVFANIIGDKIETIGLFWFAVGDKKYELQLPVKIQFEFASQRDFKGKIAPQLPEDTYIIYTLEKGDAFIYDTLHVNDIRDLQTALIKIIGAGKMPKTISYKDSLNIILKLLPASGAMDKLGVSSAVIEILLSEIYRMRRDPTKPFRLEAGKQGTSEYDFKLVRINRVPELNSNFNSLMGEDLSTELDNIVVRTRLGVKDRDTPMEKLIKM
jgi:hypothetical protein